MMRRTGLTSCSCTLLLVLSLLCPAPAALAEKPGGRAVAHRYVLFRLDPLGIAPEIVEQLERLLRVEVQKVLGPELPSRRAVDAVVASNPKLAACTADPSCLAPLARALSADRIIAGNVGGLADSYVVNLKLSTSEGRELRRVVATLRGSPEELIEEIRVAAFRLVAPDRLTGMIAVLSDVPGATVSVDGREVGQTPLATPIPALSAGVHRLEVTREGFSSFSEEVPVRFEKTTQVVVRQSAVSAKARRAERRRLRSEVPVYTRWYVWAGVAAAAITTGLVLGFTLPKQGAVDCAAAPQACP